MAGVRLTLDVKVVTSTDRACVAGTRGTVFLSDGGATGDDLLLDLCNHSQVFVAGDGNTLAVKLAPAAAPAAGADPVALVRRVLERQARACELKIVSIQAARAKSGWRVTAAVTTFGNRGTSVWTVVGSKVLISCRRRSRPAVPSLLRPVPPAVVACPCARLHAVRLFGHGATSPMACSQVLRCVRVAARP